MTATILPFPRRAPAPAPRLQRGSLARVVRGQLAGASGYVTLVSDSTAWLSMCRNGITTAFRPDELEPA
jgi:hypothetical protein